MGNLCGDMQFLLMQLIEVQLLSVLAVPFQAMSENFYLRSFKLIVIIANELMNIILRLLQMSDQASTCNQGTFSPWNLPPFPGPNQDPTYYQDAFNKQIAYSWVLIGLNCVLLAFFLLKMCKLCSFAFSYSNYHIHQTYKLYAISIINIMAALLVRKTQMDLRYFIDEYRISSKDETDANLVGYYIINDLFGIVSIFTNNILLLFNAFNWLAIAKNCDYTLSDDSSANMVQLEEYQQSQEEESIRRKQNANRKTIYYAKIYFLYCFLPMLLILSIFGTLNHKKGKDSWCIMINLSIILSSFIPLIVFSIAFGLYLKKFSDPEVSSKTKLGLVFLLVSIITRGIFYLIFLIKKQQIQSSGSLANLIYTILCSLAPMLVMVLLSEVQLHKEQFNLLRRSSGLIFKSTII